MTKSPFDAALDGAPTYILHRLARFVYYKIERLCVHSPGFVVVGSGHRFPTTPAPSEDYILKLYAGEPPELKPRDFAALPKTVIERLCVHSPSLLAIEHTYRAAVFETVRHYTAQAALAWGVGAEDEAEPRRMTWQDAAIRRLAISPNVTLDTNVVVMEDGPRLVSGVRFRWGDLVPFPAAHAAETVPDAFGPLFDFPVAK